MRPSLRGELGSLVGSCCQGRILRARPGVAHAVDYGDGAEDCDYPQDRGHSVEEGSEDNQDQAFGAFHESDAAGADEALGAGSGVADHDGADHDEGGEHYEEKASAAGIENEEAEELAGVGVAVMMESKKAPKRVTRLVARATCPSTRSKKPEKMMTSPA